MTTRGQLDRLTRRLAAHGPAQAVGGLCRCIPDRLVVSWPVAGDQVAEDDAETCPRCGGAVQVVVIDLGAGG